MRTVKHVLRPERLRQVPEQFSWIDQALVQRHFIDRCDVRAAALYLFLVTVSDAQGLSYYGEPTLARGCTWAPRSLPRRASNSSRSSLSPIRRRCTRYLPFLGIRRPLDQA